VFSCIAIVSFIFYGWNTHCSRSIKIKDILLSFCRNKQYQIYSKVSVQTCANRWRHMEHSYGFSPVCVHTCANRWRHTEHSYGFSPVCVLKDWISFWVHLLDHERNGQTGKSMKRASASWVICQFKHCVHDPINAPRMKFNPYIYIL